jgi:predicted nucleic acid-binding Zn ribbon protein
LPLTIKHCVWCGGRIIMDSRLTQAKGRETLTSKTKYKPKGLG